MLNITVRTDGGEQHAQPSAEELTDLIRRIGGRGGHFLVVLRAPELPHIFVQVWHEDGGAYTLEHRDGDTYATTELGDVSAVIDAMTRWARQETDWDAGLLWTPLEV
ncbi:hypothetical protein [uncultured Streptomyces sp.]|uniref:hypothetical protein n=1 Tax=uncultured Streptomyces sp. TaxID=174707 RepID=UPI0026036512|nr:hypothetical protein [uncultured Streptomyces sp.]